MTNVVNLKLFSITFASEFAIKNSRDNIFERNLKQLLTYKNFMMPSFVDILEFAGTFAFGVALAIVYRYAMINNMNMETIQLQKQLAEIENMNAQLQLNAEKSLNLSEVEKYASEKLGLQKPQNYQIEYIKVDKQDLVANKITNENKSGLKKILLKYNQNIRIFIIILWMITWQ